MNNLKVRYLEVKDLKKLRKDMKIREFDEIVETLDWYIEKGEGNYLCNIFDDAQIREIEKIHKNYFIGGIDER